jgi:hypothetical protein
MLLIAGVIFPISIALKFSTGPEKDITECVSEERTEVWVSIPDVHIYSDKLFFCWGSVEFDEPDKVIDVDISDVEGDRFNLGISQNVILHFKNEFIPLILIYSIEGWHMSSAPYWGDMNTRHNKTSAYLLIDNKDFVYPIDVWVTGAPFFLVGYLSCYWFLHMMKPELPMCPSDFEIEYGTSAQYKLNFIK